MFEKLNYAINRFSKRQMTFFRRMEKWGKKIHWLDYKSRNSGFELIKQYVEK